VFGTAWTLAIALTLGVTDGGHQTKAQAPVPQPPAVAWTDDRPLTHIFQNLFRDLRAVPSKNSAIVASAGGVGAAAIGGADEPFSEWADDAGETSYTSVGRALGSGWTQGGGAVATYAVGRLAGKPQVTHIGSDLIRAQTLNAVLTTVIKASVDRTRPNGARYSFPSGHTSATFASAAVLHTHYGWKVGMPAYATAGFVAWSRVRERAHWLSDVAFGSAVGILAGRTVASKHGPRRVTVVPTPTKGGGALIFYVTTSRR
jgi:hypothetical protein